LLRFRPGRIDGLHLYAGSLSLVAVVWTASLLDAGYGVRPWWLVAAIGVVATYAEANHLRLTTTTEVSTSLIPTLFAAILFGPVAAIVVAAMANIVDLWSPKDRPYLKWLTYTGTRAIAAGLSGLVAVHLQSTTGSEVAGIAIATSVGAVILEGFDVTFAAITRRVRGNGHAFEFIRAAGPVSLASMQMYAPIVALLVVAYREISPWTLPLFLVPALAAQRLYSLYQAQRELTSDLVAVNQRLERANLSFATALVATLDARDRYTAGHSAAVAVYSRDIAARMGLSESEQRLAHLCGLVHDIGKVGLPPGLLEKPGALTLEERRLMERHSEIGERILSKVEDYAEIARVVRHHHERSDGLGYPDRLSNDEIPVISRIIAVADAYNAMTSDRPYRDAMPSRVARLRLAQAVEGQFDTAVVAVFEAILAGAPEDYRLGVGTKFTFGWQWKSSRQVDEVSGGDERCFGPRANTELLENVSEMHLDSDLTDEQSLGYRLIREALGQ
jgi:putative nucleotidyltransferase with HDIG domain